MDAPRSLSYSWRGDGAAGPVTEVTYLLEPVPGGCRFTWTHTGFTGIGGLFMSLLSARVRRRMLNVGVPAVLEEYQHGRP